MQTAEEISEEAYEQAINLNNNIENSIISVDIDDEDLFDVQEGQDVHVYVTVRLVTV